jgi:hypothetical protein
MIYKIINKRKKKLIAPVRKSLETLPLNEVKTETKHIIKMERLSISIAKNMDEEVLFRGGGSVKTKKIVR